MDERIKEHLTALEKLLRDADDRLAGGYDLETWERKRARRQRNAINAACNALHKAARA